MPTSAPDGPGTPDHTGHAEYVRYVRYVRNIRAPSAGRQAAQLSPGASSQSAHSAGGRGARTGSGHGGGHERLLHRQPASHPHGTDGQPAEGGRPARRGQAPRPDSGGQEGLRSGGPGGPEQPGQPGRRDPARRSGQGRRSRRSRRRPRQAGGAPRTRRRGAVHRHPDAHRPGHAGVLRLRQRGGRLHRQGRPLRLHLDRGLPAAAVGGHQRSSRHRPPAPPGQLPGGGHA